MKAWWIRSADGKTAIDVRDVAAPKPAAGQLLVRVRAAALNRGEFIAAHGLHAPARPRNRLARNAPAR